VDPFEFLRGAHLRVGGALGGVHRLEAREQCVPVDEELAEREEHEERERRGQLHPSAAGARGRPRRDAHHEAGGGERPRSARPEEVAERRPTRGAEHRDDERRPESALEARGRDGSGRHERRRAGRAADRRPPGSGQRRRRGRAAGTHVTHDFG
jgi:hypothetical protein